MKRYNALCHLIASDVIFMLTVYACKYEALCYLSFITHHGSGYNAL